MSDAMRRRALLALLLSFNAACPCLAACPCVVPDLAADRTAGGNLIYRPSGKGGEGYVLPDLAKAATKSKL